VSAPHQSTRRKNSVPCKYLRVGQRYRTACSGPGRAQERSFDSPGSTVAWLSSTAVRPHRGPRDSCRRRRRAPSETSGVRPPPSPCSRVMPQAGVHRAVTMSGHAVPLWRGSDLQIPAESLSAGAAQPGGRRQDHRHPVLNYHVQSIGASHALDWSSLGRFEATATCILWHSLEVTTPKDHSSCICRTPRQFHPCKRISFQTCTDCACILLIKLIASVQILWCKTLDYRLAFDSEYFPWRDA
jgi:hypothetical protein